MGFTTGLLGGITLTTTIVYLSLDLHACNRAHQSAILHQQNLLLNNLLDPQPPSPPSTNREVRVGLWETAKDKWNAELDESVRRLQSVDWADVTTGLEEKVSAVYRRAFQKSREAVEENVK